MLIDPIAFFCWDDIVFIVVWFQDWSRGTTLFNGAVLCRLKMKMCQKVPFWQFKMPCMGSDQNDSFFIVHQSVAANLEVKNGTGDVSRPGYHFYARKRPLRYHWVPLENFSSPCFRLSPASDDTGNYRHIFCSYSLPQKLLTKRFFCG